MFNWKLKATNAIFLEDNNGQEGRPFKARFLQAGLVKYDFGVCLLKKETIDKFVNTFVECPVIIDHKDNIAASDVVGTIKNIWFSAEDGWFWCSGILTSEKAIKLIEDGYNVSCQYRITDYVDNDEGKLHNANPYDKEILDGVFEHLAIVENPRYEDAFIAVNAYIATNDKWITVHPNGKENEGRPLLIKDGESVEDALHRRGWYSKRQAKDERKERTFIDKKTGKEQTLKDLVDKGLVPVRYSGSLWDNKPSYGIGDDKIEYKITEDEYKQALEHQKNKKNEDLKKAKEKSKDLADYIKWQYSQDIEPFITRYIDNKTIVNWNNMSKETQSALKRLDYDDKIKLAEYSGSEKSIQIKDKKILENLQKHKKSMASNATIATNQEFNEEDHPRDDEGKFTTEGGVNPNYKEELKQVIEKAKNNPNERQKLAIGKVSDKLQEKAKENGFDISGYSHDLDVSGTRHAIKGHSNEKAEEKRGQIALTDKDFEHIPDIIYNFDDVTFGEEDSKGTPLVKYQKTFQDGTTIYIEEIRSRQKTLTIKTMYKTKKASNSRTFTDFNSQRQEYTSNIIIAYNSDDFNPNVTINKAVNKYKRVFDYIRTTKGEAMDNETKGLFSALVDALKARNEAEDEKGKEKQDPKASNEDVDKRKLIDEVGGILKGKVDEEVWRTIIGKIEKVAYEKSEAGAADNSRAKNEDPEPKKDGEPKKDKEAENRCKNDDNRDYKSLYEELKAKVEEAENKKAKNSLDETVNKLYSALVPEQKDLYISPEKGLELGKRIYG